MVLRMARPVKHSTSGKFYIRQRVPRDLLGKARSRRLVLPREAGGGTITISGSHVKASLRTAEPATARERHAAALNYLEKFWRALRAGPRRLSHRETVALAGELYRMFAESFEDDPGSPTRWQGVREMNVNAANGKYSQLAIPAPVEQGEQTEMRKRTMEMRFGKLTDALLASKALLIDEESRGRLMDEIGRALTQAADKLERNADGDYEPDPIAARFPAWIPAEELKKTGNATITGLLEAWKVEARAAGRTEKTLSEYNSRVRRFVRFLGHDNALKVTPQDVVRWKDRRLAEGISARTVANSDLTALKVIFGWAVTNHRLPANPATAIKLRIGRKTHERDKGFTDEEALSILNAAFNYVSGKNEHAKTAAAKRWVPFLCAYTGARVGEMVQLRRQDVRREGKHWIATITPEAGTVKNKRRREVVLHPHLIELGFAKFCERSDGYLFLNAKGKADALGKLQALKNRLAEFARALVLDTRVAPNHGWRHRFITLGRQAEISDRVIDAICGHAPSSVAAEYGYVTFATQAAALAKLPRYSVAKRHTTAPLR